MSATAFPSPAAALDRMMAALARRHTLAGHLHLVLPSARTIDFGRKRDEPSAEIHLRSYKALWAALRGGSLGLCEAYVDGAWDSPDPARVLAFFLANGAKFDRAGKIASVFNLVDRLWHWRRANSRTGSKRNIEAHYDLGNGFYELWLDETMTYSAAWFGDGAQDLATAQRDKYRRVLSALELEPGHRLLEIGCGWGGFAEAATEAGANVTGLTLSSEQLAFAQQRLGANADLRLQDYRDVGGAYDRIASIEMIEAVGEAYWPQYFATLAQRLKPGGVAVIQAITIAPALFPLYRRNVDFIQRHIFPGGMLPTEDILASQARAVGLTYEPLDRFGMDYARTLALWRRRFEEAWPKIQALGFDDRFRRKWRLYLAYCEEGFRARTIDVGFYRFVNAKPA
jgi:cyclopropane-fatty-acyl-phospholipid synthase